MLRTDDSDTHNDTKIVLTHERAAFVRETIDPAKMTDTKIALIKRDCGSGSEQANHEVQAKQEQRCEATHHAAHMWRHARAEGKELTYLMSSRGMPFSSSMN